MSGFNRKWMDDITRRLDSMETRVWKLEEALLGIHKLEGKSTLSKNFTGLSGAVTKIIRDGILNTPKTRKEVQHELERRGFYYSPQAIHTCLTRDFMKKRGILTRIGKRGEWRYVVRK